MLEKVGLKKFLNRVKVGLILRAYAARPELVAGTVLQIRQTVDRFRALQIENHRVVSRIDILVWADSRYRATWEDNRFPLADCGETHSALLKEFSADIGKLIEVTEVTRGDLYCGILNRGVMMQAIAGVQYSTIFSHQAYPYVNNETLRLMIQGACDGARVVPVVINELPGVIEGLAGNTFCMWHNASLMQVGGFDSSRSGLKPQSTLANNNWRKWDTGKGYDYYWSAGVEEIVPLIKMIEEFGKDQPFIASVFAFDADGKQYVVPDPEQDPDGYLRHIRKLNTKLPRQQAMASMLQSDISVLKGAVMPEYLQS